MNEIQKDVYALAWLLGVSLLLAWLILLAESGLRKWRVLIQQETARQAEQAAILRHAMDRGRREAAMPAYMTVNYEDIELRILAGMSEAEVAELLAYRAPRTREIHLCNM